MNKFKDKNLKKILTSLLNDKILYEKYYQILTKESDKPVVKHEKTSQLTIILKGKGFALINDKRINFKENDVIFVPSNSTHAFVAISNAIELFHIHLPYEFIETDRVIIKEKFDE